MNNHPETASSSLEPGAEIFGAAITRQRLEQEILPAYVGRARWFGGKAKGTKCFTILSAPALANARLLLVRVDYENGPAETYLVPLRLAVGEEARVIAEERPEVIAGRVGNGDVLFDAIHDEAFRAALFSLVTEGGSLSGNSEIVGMPGHVPTDLGGSLSSRVLAAEQSNSAIVFGDRVFLKLYRRIEEGMNPDAEILRFLSDHGFTQAPPFFGALEVRGADGGRHVLALALGMVAHQSDAWTFTLGELRKYYARAFAENFDATPFAGLSHLDPTPAPNAATKLVGEDLLARVRQLSERTGELHLALASEKEDQAFAPETFGESDRLSLAAAIRNEGTRALEILKERRDCLPTDLADSVAALSASAPLISNSASRLEAAAHLETSKTRTHGDYHLGQVLDTGDDFVILDFEGEPARTLAERRLKRSPLRDVAGMLRSFHYAAYSVASELGDQRTQAEPLGELWAAIVSRAFLQAWLSKTAGAVFVPAQSADLAQLLEAFLLEKALYEIAYELNNRPTWVGIPLRGILSLLREG